MRREEKRDRKKPRGATRRRKGTTYLAVCGMVLLVATVALGGLAATRVRARAIRNGNDVAEARQYAISATEVGRLWIAQDKNWRTDYSNGAWFTNKPIGRGTFSLSVTNPNGALNHSSFDPVVLSATGNCGKAIQYAQVTLGAQTTPYTCLTAALSAALGITVNGTGVIDAKNQTLATNGSAFFFGGVTVNANVAAAGFILGGNNGSDTFLATPLTFPDSTAFSYYQQNGTAISISSIPGSNIQNVLISPTSNPYGAADPKGVYVIDCQNRDMNISHCRIVATLVLLNPGNITIQDAVVWSPAVSNYPCLMVNGGLTVNSPGNYLQESGGNNYNPPGTPYPYPSGTSNATTTDSYPPAVQGLIYAAGNLTLQGAEFAANVVVVGGTFSSNGGPTLYLSYDPTYNKSPPPGFGIIQMPVTPGSWQQVVH